jgi:predicted ATPase
MQIKSINVENFKALRASGTVRLKPLSVIIGNNGSGKSSLLEAAETYVRILDEGVEGAMKHWQGFEHIWHKAAQTGKASAAPLAKQPNPMKLTLNLKVGTANSKLSVAVNTADNGNFLYIQQEQGQIGASSFERSAVGRSANQSLGIMNSLDLQSSMEAALKSVGSANSLLPFLGAFDKVTRSLRSTLFLRLNPDAIGQLQSVSRSGQRIQLAGDGSNVAEYLIDLRERSPSAFEQIADALRYVLPYASDVEPKVLDAGIIRRSYVQLLESKYEIPGWLMSSGSLRVLPLIATLLDPDPPSVIFIEEVENGLDPRTVGLVVDLMRAAAQSGRTQVIATTHSPYLLDMLDLDDVLLCERGEKGPAFSWPGSRAEMQAWRDSFMPGRLYTMNALQHEAEPAAGETTSQVGEAPEGGWGNEE